MSSKNWVSHRKYAKISSQKRRRLILMVTEQNKSIVQTSKQLKIKLSTAKLILKKFKETGTFFDKKMPDYCRRTRKCPLPLQESNFPVKLEDNCPVVSLSEIPQGNEAEEGYLGQGEADCKQEEQVPTMLYFYYFY